MDTKPGKEMPNVDDEVVKSERPGFGMAEPVNPLAGNVALLRLDFMGHRKFTYMMMVIFSLIEADDFKFSFNGLADKLALDGKKELDALRDALSGLAGTIDSGYDPSVFEACQKERDHEYVVNLLASDVKPFCFSYERS